MHAVVVVAILTGLVIFILCIPLDLTLRVDSYPRPAFRARLTWLFGLVRRETTRVPVRRKALERWRRIVRRKELRRVIFGALRSGKTLRGAVRLLEGMIAALRVREFVVDFEVGLGDPADTGMLFAFLGPIVLLLNSVLGGQVCVRPDFTPQPALAGHSYLELRMRPIRFLSPVLRFALSPSGMRTVRAVLTRR